MTKYESDFQKILQAETVSVCGQTDLTKFRKFHKLLAELFPALWGVSTVEDFNGSLLIKWPGKNADSPMLFMNHHDVVEATGAWSHDPFAAEIVDGKIYARGAVDTKGGLFAMLEAADEMAASGFVPECDIYFESACNEEISGEGAREIAAELAKRNIRFKLILDEGGGVFDDVAMIGIGEKGVTDLRFIARSAGGHASRPPKNQPFVKLAKFISYTEDHLDEIFPKKVNEQTGEIQQTSLAFTVAKGSEGNNVLPVEASIVGNMRSSHHQTVDGSIDAITKLAASFGVETEVMFHGETSAIADFSSDACGKLKDVIQKFWPGVKIVPTIMTGATDECYMCSLSDSPVRFSPFRYTEEQKNSIHSIDENVDVATLPVAVDFFKEIYKL